MKNKGFSAVMLLAITGVLLAVGLIGWRVWGAAGDDSNGSDGSNDSQTTVDDENADTTDADPDDVEAIVNEYTIDVWADNWFALYVNGEKVGEDSVPITTERSFNKETLTFKASIPMTIAIEARDYKETDSGLEYIGANNQQMGDGGIIAQVKNSSGSVVAATTGDWKAFITHFAPLEKTCESSLNPDQECESEITEAPSNWFTKDFDDSSWTKADVYTESQVDPKIGYDEVEWDDSAQLIWGDDLEQVNTVLLRTVVLQ